ncbi:ribosome-binding factor A [Sphaerisporangium melleum]|uniref:Ribosome-binding factor A n=1 Tax=Sphaerisporangium melleum TaxID=321316 RepID=A0A917R1T5_9ACTN|nr:ribosome-binding factor A [Sphaerisporangium melleum]GII69278.1 ribosome-binding factor A [Sphaerisporangium melleum]
MDAARARKLADRIQQVVAEMLERRIKDPRLGFVTVTDARITADLRDATVFYTVFGSEAERADTAAALESAKGIIRAEVGRQTGVRHTPTLTFSHDPLPDSARHLDELLAEARARDEEIAKRAAGAVHAGDADPYRKPGEESPDGEEAPEEFEAGPADRAGRSAQ